MICGALASDCHWLRVLDFRCPAVRRRRDGGGPSTPGIVVYHLPIKRLPGSRADKYAADWEMRTPIRPEKYLC